MSQPPVVFDVPSDFVVEGIVGQGAYGAVCRATWDGIDVAIKKIPQYTKSPETAKKVLREVEILQHFQYCQQVVGCHTIFRPKSGDKDLYAVMDYIPADISSTMKMGVKMDEDVVRYIVCQLLLALRTMHFYGCMHRDLSCRNILIDEESRVSVCDFGLSRFFDPEEQLSFGVVTQWYRAPEIITDAKYSTQSDVFSVGVIMGELLLRRHLFPGKPNDPADQLHRVFQILGTPDLDLFQTPNKPFHSSSANAKRYVEMYAQKKPLKNRIHEQPFAVPHAPEGTDLLAKLLAFNPEERLSANEALQHPWFAPLQDYISQEVASQDEHHATTKFSPTVIPPGTKQDEVVKMIESLVPVYNREITEKWRAANAEQESNAEEGGENAPEAETEEE